jgi:acylphosphatase
MTQEQRIVRFKGNVQGVGFRYTTCRLAGDHQVTGYVKNLPDGSVECVTEGEQGEIEAFLESVEQQMGNYIHDRTEQKAPYSGRFDSFGVAF